MFQQPMLGLVLGETLGRSGRLGRFAWNASHRLIRPDRGAVAWTYSI